MKNKNIFMCAVFVCVILIISCGQKFNVPSNTNVKTSSTRATDEKSQDKVNFNCNSILPDSDFERITGNKINEYPAKEKVKMDEFGGGILCSYAKGASVPLIINVAWYSYKGKQTDASVGVEGLIITGDNAAKEQGRPEAVSKKIDGVGYEAYSIPAGLIAVSSNKKYSIMISGNWLWDALSGNSDSTSKLNSQKAIAKIIDTNLNKY